MADGKYTISIMRYYLVKSDPEEYGISDLEHEKIGTWDGVCNPQAVAYLKEMQKGDRVLIYHSQGEKTIVGLAEMAGNSRPDPKEPRSWLVDLKFIRHFDKPFVTLQRVKASGLFGREAGFKLTYHPRLSVMPAPDNFISWLKNQPGIDLS